MIENLLKYDFDSCLDVGANTGQFANEVLQYKNIRIVSIEPNSFCAGKLKRLLNEVYICALGNENKKLNLLIPSDKKHSKASSFYLHANKTGENDVIEMEVDVVRGDDLFKIDQFYLIKIYTQGYEYFVIVVAR